MDKTILITHSMKLLKKSNTNTAFFLIAEHIATPEAPRPMFCTVNIDGEHHLLDDEGLCRASKKQWEGYHQQGRGLILGIDYETGESVPSRVHGKLRRLSHSGATSSE